MFAFTVFLAWVACAVGAKPLVASAAPLVAKLHERTLAFYAALDDRQREILHWALALTAYGPLTLANYVGTMLLMPFLCAALLAAGAFTSHSTRLLALGALASAAPSLVPETRRLLAQLDAAGNTLLIEMSDGTAALKDDHQVSAESLANGSDDEKVVGAPAEEDQEF